MLVSKNGKIVILSEVDIAHHKGIRNHMLSAEIVLKCDTTDRARNFHVIKNRFGGYGYVMDEFFNEFGVHLLPTGENKLVFGFRSNEDSMFMKIKYGY